MFYYLDTSSQIRRIVKNTGLVDNNYKTSERSSDNTLIDFIDGELYKRILNSRIGSAVKRKESFTMTFNNFSTTINKATAKTTPLEDQFKQSQYQIQLLTDQTKNLQLRLDESNNLLLEKEKQFNLLKNELDESKKQAESLNQKS